MRIVDWVDTMSQESGPAWLAVWTKARAEKAVANDLAALSVPHWLPIMVARRRWSDRWKNVSVPLFPNYLFAQSTGSDWHSLLRVPGVLTVVKQGRTPAWIQDRQLADLRFAIERVGADAEPSADVVDDFVLGDRVRVIRGPMSGLTGVVRQRRGSRRLLIGIEQIGRALSVSIDGADVEPVRD